MKELWKPIEGTNGKYEVSNTGKVRSLSYLGHDKIQELKQNTDRGGYLCVTLYMDGVRTFKLVHRLVALAFMPNPHGKEQINHIDGNKKNNHVSNLEWCTRLENARHAADSGLWDKQINKFKERNAEIRIPTIVVNICTGEVKEYESTTQADTAHGDIHINELLHKRQIQSKGYIAYYKDKYEKMSAFDKEQDIQRAIKSYKVYGERKKIPIIAINIQTGEKAMYESISEAGRKTGAKVPSILLVLSGKRKTSKGFTFEKQEEGVMP